MIAEITTKFYLQSQLAGTMILRKIHTAAAKLQRRTIEWLDATLNLCQQPGVVFVIDTYEGAARGPIPSGMDLLFVPCDAALVRRSRQEVGERQPILAVAESPVSDEALAKVLDAGATDYILADGGTDDASDFGPDVDPERILTILRWHLNLTPPWPLVGSSAKMRALHERVSEVARVGSPNVCLIIGERGSGKELVAKAIHGYKRESAGRDIPWIAENSLAIPDQLFEGQLFGHLKGSFTNAIANHSGLVKAADGGVLFLDEIGQLNLDNQGKLLRFLQEFRYRPLSGTERKADIFVIVATNSKFDDSKKFRSDLYDRLKSYKIQVPSLSERREDIPLLARYFTRVNLNLGKQRQTVTNISPAALAKLLSYEYPGNVRVLANIIANAKLRVSGKLLLPEHLKPEEQDAVQMRPRATGLPSVTKVNAEDAGSEDAHQSKKGSWYKQPKKSSKSAVVAVLKALGSAPLPRGEQEQRNAILAVFRNNGLRFLDFRALTREITNHCRIDDSLLDIAPPLVRSLIVTEQQQIKEQNEKARLKREGVVEIDQSEVGSTSDIGQLGVQDPSAASSRCYFALFDPFCQQQIERDYRMRGYPSAEIFGMVREEVRYGLKAAALVQEQVIFRASAVLKSDLSAQILREARELVEHGILVPEFRSDETSISKLLREQPQAFNRDSRSACAVFDLAELLDSKREPSIEVAGTNLSQSRSQVLIDHLFRQKALADLLSEPYLKGEVSWADLGQLFELLNSHRPVDRREFIERVQHFYTVPSRAVLLVQLVYFGLGAARVRANPYLPQLLEPTTRLWIYPKIKVGALPYEASTVAERYGILSREQRFGSLAFNAGIVRPDKLADVLRLSELLIKHLDWQDIIGLRRHEVGVRTRRLIADFQRGAQSEPDSVERCRRSLYEELLREQRHQVSRYEPPLSSPLVKAEREMLFLIERPAVSRNQMVVIGSVPAETDERALGDENYDTPLLLFSQLAYGTQIKKPNALS